MQRHSIDQLLRLPEGKAVERYFDGLNYRVYRWLLYGFGPGALIGMMVWISEGQTLQVVAWALNLLGVGILFLSRKSRFFEINFREVLILYIAAQFVAVFVGGPNPEFRFAFSSFLAPATLVFFRLRTTEYGWLLALFLAGTGWGVLHNSMGEELDGQIGGAVTAVIIAAIVLTISRKLTRRTGERFRIQWRREVSREQEQTRMRDELNDARKVQLSMLPSAAPSVSWLDISSATLPASEVGGDYYDYVSLDENRLAVVIGDVAGHGMASGLLLAAVRGGLHLLRGELTEPRIVLERLDQMVREVAPTRMFMTLQIALIDRGQGRLTVVNAGHPPVLHYSPAAGAIEALGSAAIPLGTHLESRLESVTHPLQAGDVLFFYTDGLPELLDLRGEAFGDDRLAHTLARVAKSGSSRQIRDGILDTITHFKNDAEMQDDLTIVVVRVRG